MSLLECGLSLADMRSITLGMAANIIAEHTKREKIRRGIKISDPETEYKKLKENETMIDSLYKQGNIKEEKYKAFKKQLADWENG